MIDVIDPETDGRQIKNQPSKGTWLACAVFCETGSGAWYSPKKELQNLNLDPFFPDGVHCHSEGDVNYYCQKNLCLGEDHYSSAKSNLERDAAVAGQEELFKESDYNLDDAYIIDEEGIITGIATPN